MKPFKDRRDAGHKLAAALREENPQDPLLLALPRGGVPVAEQIHQETGWEWDVWVSRKIVDPQNPEFALGALAERGDPLWGGEERSAEKAREEIRDLRQRLRGSRPAPEVGGRLVVVVDDGLATGWTARAAARAIRSGGASEVWGAFPAGPRGADLGGDFDKAVFLLQPSDFRFVSEYYQSFNPVEEAETLRLLESAPVSQRQALPS